MTRIIIPARLQSTRLPEKLLRVVGSASVLQHTYQAAARSGVDAEPIVAVDDRRLADEVDAFGGRWVMTPVNCPSGTDRIAAAVDQLIRDGVMHSNTPVVNVQGDEPEISGEAICRVANLIECSNAAAMSTAVTPIRDVQKLHDPNVVKCVLAIDPANSPEDFYCGRALYFSRSAVPHDRDGACDLTTDPPMVWHHVGLYGYTPQTLRWFASEQPSPLERIEKLEQLRILEAGKTIMAASIPVAAPGIDTAEDLEAFRMRAA